MSTASRPAHSSLPGLRGSETFPLSLEPARSRRAGQLQEHHRRADLFLLLGGSGKQISREMELHAPELLDSCLIGDMDGWGDRARVREEITFSGDGDVARCLEHAANYPALAGWPLISSMKPADTGDGAAMCRSYTTAAVATYIEELKQRLTSMILEVLSRFEGREAKRLCVAIAASNSGGSGSALAFLFAMFVRHIVRTLAPSLVTVIDWHLVNVKAFERVLSTPAEKLKASQNALSVLKELQFSQNPDNLESLAEAFSLSNPVEPLFDKVLVYDSITEGSSVLSEASLYREISRNLTAGQCEPLAGQLQSHGRNTTRSIEGAARRGGAESCILAGQRSMILRASVRKMQHIAALGLTIADVDRVLGTHEGSDEIRSGRDVDRILGLSERLDSKLQQLLGSSLDTVRLPEDPRLTDEVISHRARRAEQGWSEGFERLKSSARVAADDLADEARRVFEQARDELAESATAQQHERRLRAAHDKVCAELANVDDECRRISEARLDDRVEVAHSAFLRRKTWLAGRRRSRECADYLAAFNDRVARRSRQVVLEIFRDRFLVSLRDDLRRELNRIRGVIEDVHAVRTEALLQSKDLADHFAHQAPGITEVIRPSDVEFATKRVIEEVGTLHAHESELLTWKSLAQADSSQAELEDVLRSHFIRVDKFTHAEWRDVRGVLRFIGRTDLSLEQWIADASQEPLPCRLDLAEYGRAHSPRHGFVAAAAELESMTRRIQFPRDIEFEFVANDDPFQIIVQINQTHAPISAFPGLREIVRKAALFQASSPTDAVWCYPSLHHTLEAAQQVELLPPASINPGRNRVAAILKNSGSPRAAIGSDDSSIMRNSEL